MNLSNEVGIEKLRRQHDANPRWPTDRGAISIFPSNPTISHLDRDRMLKHYEALMMREFQGRNVRLLDHEYLETPVPARWAPEKTEAQRKVRRHFCKVEYDSWRKAPDPEPTFWEAVKHWLLKTELPKAEQPTRTVKYFSMSPAQFRIFEYNYVRGSKIWEVS